MPGKEFVDGMNPKSMSGLACLPTLPASKLSGFGMGFRTILGLVFLSVCFCGDIFEARLKDNEDPGVQTLAQCKAILAAFAAGLGLTVGFTLQRCQKITACEVIA